MKHTFSALLLLGGTSLTAFCQNLSQEVDVEHDLVVEHRDFSRLLQQPAVSLGSVAVRPLDFSQRLMSVTVEPTARLFEPTAYADTLETSPWKGYLMAGYWPAYHVDLSAGYRIIDTDHTRLSAWGQLNGANYKRQGVEHRRTSIAVGADLRQAMGRESYLDASLTYRYHYLTPMYELTDPQGSLLTGTWKQYVNNVAAALMWHSSVGGMRYNAGAAYHYFGYRNGLPYWVPFAETSPELDPRNPVRENLFRLGGDARLPLSDNLTAALDLSLDLLNNSRHSSLVYPMSIDQWRIDPARGAWTHALVDLKPHVLLTTSAITADLGLRLDFSANCGTFFRVAPDARITWRPDPLIAISGEATGGVRQNTLASLFEVNWLNAPMVAYANSYVPVDARVAVTLGPINACYGEIFAGYSRAEDWLMPQLQGATSIFKAQAIDGWRAGVKLGGKYRDLATLSATFTAAPSGYDKGYYLWRDRARYVVETSLTVTPIKPLDITVGYELRACRSICDREYNIVAPHRITDIYTPLHTISDIDLGGVWRFDRRLSVFLTLENLLSRHPLTVGGIPMEGFRGLVGASYKF